MSFTWQAHCKIAWDNEEDRLDYAEFFDYRSSHKQLKADGGEAEWEDVSSDTSDAAMDVDEESDELPPALSFGDSAFELVLPNGTRIGHRALRHIYKQNLLPYAIGSQAVKTGSNMKLITQLARLALVPARGGGSPSGGELVQARNRGEAREAGRHIREFRDAHRRELFKTRVGCTSGNNQKHCELIVSFMDADCDHTSGAADTLALPPSKKIAIPSCSEFMDGFIRCCRVVICSTYVVHDLMMFSSSMTHYLFMDQKCACRILTKCLLPSFIIYGLI